MTAEPLPSPVPLLDARSIEKRYRVSRGLLRGKKTLHALAGVDLTIPKGGILGLVGESGSGKSTLARLLLGLEAPSAGLIRLEGRPLAAIDRKSLARRIQPVFQDPFSSLNPAQRIGDIIELPLKVHRIGDASDRARRLAQLLDQVGLPSRAAAAFPRELSGGQRQRAAIARALAIAPELLICDEPTSALDVSVQAQILNLLADLRRETGVAMLFISHDLAVVEHMTDRVAVLYLGRIVEAGPTDAVFHAPKHPYAQALRSAVLVPQEGGGLPELGLGTSFPNPLDPPSGCRFHTRCPLAEPRCAREAPLPRHGDDRSVECHLAQL
ncbi:oligopeptide/dipeptide ABC transporter ATP-binding protein [Algihabitans albus]|uniref:oligopeptide/dipeptide ABC transporter ATP-binding protein n=1 Tax=Algihabitans albus TaxID=2164067 RepID=UPI000E5CC280|nr:oligopeptide/dipeptide ABC transporter ATP-binding protein [Algihabitans albus]